MLEIWWGIASLAHLSTPMIARKKEKQRTVLSLLDFQSSADKKLAKTQDRKTLQNF